MEQFKNDLDQITAKCATKAHKLAEQKRAAIENYTGEMLTDAMQQNEQDRRTLAENTVEHINDALERARNRIADNSGIGGKNLKTPDVEMLKYDMKQAEFDTLVQRNKENRSMDIAFRDYANQHSSIRYTPMLPVDDLLTAADKLARAAISWVYSGGVTDTAPAFMAANHITPTGDIKFSVMF